MEFFESVGGLSNLTLLDFHQTHESFKTHVFQGLRHEHKYIPSKFLYDERGSELFDQICDQPEYYQTAAELEILKSNGRTIVEGSGQTLLIEFGSGHNRKIRNLLKHLEPGSAYVPIDISRNYLLTNAESVANEFPDIFVSAVCADFLAPLEIPLDAAHYQNRIVFFPGSTIGNFEPQTQAGIIANAKRILGKGGSLVVGVDRKNSRTVLEAAYNDRAGITAEFEANILDRINRELRADFDRRHFSYHGFYNEAASRVEMYLVSEIDQQVKIDGHIFKFGKGEKIHIENSYKYSFAEFVQFCREQGLQLRSFWRDRERRFFVYRFDV